MCGVKVFDYLLGHTQHPFTVEFVERQVRIQIKDQIDRMKRRKVDEYEYSGSDEESGGGSLDHPTIKKSDEGTSPLVCSVYSRDEVKPLNRAGQTSCSSSCRLSNQGTLYYS